MGPEEMLENAALNGQSTPPLFWVFIGFYLLIGAIIVSNWVWDFIKEWYEDFKNMKVPEKKLDK